MRTQPIQIIRGSDDELVDAKLYEGLRAVDLTLIERQWGSWRQDIIRKLVFASVEQSKWPQSLHWDWSGKIRQLQLLAIQSNAIDCENEWQAAVVTDSVTHRCLLGIQKGKPILYVDYVETAPWNWQVPEIGLSRRYRGLGELLMTNAVECSFDLGFKGRLGLHALPQAEGFYENRIGMTPLGKIPGSYNLNYFEFTEVQATRYLQ